MLDTFTNLQGSQTMRGTIFLPEWLDTFTNLQGSQTGHPIHNPSYSLTPLRIYKVLKPQMVFTEPPLPGLQHKFKGFSESSTCPYQ